MKQQREHVVDLLFSLSLLCVFTACGLVVVFIGINVYKNTVEDMTTAFASRTAMAYIAKQVHQNDATDAISIAEIEGTQALAITKTQDGEAYCTYIYYDAGYLQELDAKASFTPVRSAGQKLLEIDGFAITEQQNGTFTVTVTTAAGESSLILATQSG